MRRPTAYSGTQFTIAYAVLLDQSSPGEVFYDGLEDGDKAKLNKLFERFGDHGKIVNEEKFKKIDKTEFFEFKSFKIRMPCFFSTSQTKLLVITHGFLKKTDKLPRVEIKRAERIKGEDEQNDEHEHQRGRGRGNKL
jgi:hypothetical protein